MVKEAVMTTHYALYDGEAHIDVMYTIVQSFRWQSMFQLSKPKLELMNWAYYWTLDGFGSVSSWSLCRISHGML